MSDILEDAEFEQTLECLAGDELGKFNARQLHRVERKVDHMAKNVHWNTIRSWYNFALIMLIIVTLVTLGLLDPNVFKLISLGIAKLIAGFA